MPGRLSIVALATIGFGLAAARAIAQVDVIQVQTVEELRGELSPGDNVTIVRSPESVVSGQLVRFGPLDLEIRGKISQGPGQPGSVATLSIPHDTIRSLERTGDSTKNGMLIGAAVGGGFGLFNLIYYGIVDANEIDEYSGSLVVGMAADAGIGALVGYFIDKLHTRPPIRFEVASGEQTGITPPPPIARRPEPVFQGRERARFVVGGDFGWVHDSKKPQSYGPAIENTNVDTPTTGSTVSAGVFVKPDVSIWGEWTKLAPATVGYSGMWLCQRVSAGQSCTSLTDWPSQTLPNEEVALYGLSTRMPYSVSGLVGYRWPNWRRVYLTFLAGLTLRPYEEAYRDERHTVPAPGVHVLKSTAADGSTHRETHVGLALGVDPQILLSSHLTVVPKLRFDLGPEFTRARAGLGIQWNF